MSVSFKAEKETLIAPQFVEPQKNIKSNQAIVVHGRCDS